MRQATTGLLALVAALLVVLPSLSRVSADDAKTKTKAKTKAIATAKQPATDDENIPTYNLLEAMSQGLVGVEASGRGDGRMTVSVTNNTKKQLRVVLPPGIIAQGATGQFGGMGGMGGMGGGIGGMGGMGGGMMGGMGGMGGMGMGGMGGMGGGMMGGGMTARTMPPTMGMMMLARLIMYLCGDYDSWDQRSLSIGMMGMGGMGMGGMGGGMGGMGGGMGGMGGGMRSVPPTSLPFANLKPGQKRDLPTRLVSLSQPDPESETGVSFPAKDEKLQLGEVSQINGDDRVQKALKRLAADKAPATISQLVMWRLNVGMDWDRIAQISSAWANAYELTLAQQFVDRLDSLPDAETGTILFDVQSTGAAGAAHAAALTKELNEKAFLGLKTKLGIPTQPEGPAVGCRVKFAAGEATVQVVCSDGSASKWVPFGKFSLPLTAGTEKFEAAKFGEALAEGVLSRMVRAQYMRGPTVKGKATYQVRIDNASPLVLNGLAVLGTETKTEEQPKELSGICIAPRRSMTVPATEEVVKTLGLRKGIRVVAADLSGL
ncbi:MAG: hypothetical protein WBQ11_20900 [Isosphaeraceae bacterium]